jgi:16S rRNA (guanine527-N7)-methyltransferase
VDERDRALLDRWSSEAFGLGLDDAAATRIGRFLDLLDVWNRRLRLTGERDRRTLVRKHVADAMACAPYVPRRGAILDLGTGAGFPGVVLACLRPDVTTTLLDSRERAASFLREVVRTVPLPHARVLLSRAEDAARDAAVAGLQDLVTSRAIRMDDCFRLASALRAPSGVVVSMQTPKTSRRAAEESAARHGLGTVEIRDYRLPDGEQRRLVVAA